MSEPGSTIDPRSTAVDSIATAEAHGTGPAINIVLGSEAIKPFAWFAGAVLAVALLISIIAFGLTIYGLTTANELSRKFDKVEREARLQAYWAQRAEVAMDK